MIFGFPFSKTSKHLILAYSTAFACLMLPSSAFAACSGNTNPNLVKNPSFELDPNQSTTITDWDVAFPDTNVTVTNAVAKGGAQSLAMGSETGEDTVGQSIAGTQAGHVYTVCFYLSNGATIPGGATDFHARWNGEDQFVLQHTTNLPFAYEAFNVVATGNDVLAFSARNVPKFFYLDSVIVQECTNCSLNPGSRNRLKERRSESISQN